MDCFDNGGFADLMPTDAPSFIEILETQRSDRPGCRTAPESPRTPRRLDYTGFRAMGSLRSPSSPLASLAKSRGGRSRQVSNYPMASPVAMARAATHQPQRSYPTSTLSNHTFTQFASQDEQSNIPMPETQLTWSAMPTLEEQEEADISRFIDHTASYLPSPQKTTDQSQYYPSSGTTPIESHFNVGAQASSGTTESHLNITPINSPTQPMRSAPNSTTKRSRTHLGLGTPSGAHRTAKRIRQATYDANTLPASPNSRRRQTDPVTSLMTSQPLPLTRISSSSHLGVNRPHFIQERGVSVASGVSMATSYDIGSPSSNTYSMDYSMMMGGHVPDFTSSHHASQHPSPNPSNCGLMGVLSSQPGGHVFTSPENDQTAFMPDASSLLPDTEQYVDTQSNEYASMQIPPSLPGSASFGSVASFSGQPDYRQGTLSTIAELETPMMPSQGYMQQQHMPPAPQFEAQQYPPVPGMHISSYPTANNGVDISQWSMQTQNSFNASYDPPPQQAHYGYSQPQQPFHGPMPGLSRHVSASSLPYPMSHSNSYSVPRSRRVSEQRFSHPPQPNMAGLPMSMSAGGIFPGPPMHAESSMMARMDSSYEATEHSIYANDNSQHQPAISSPDTPRRRQAHPPVGKRLKPGPKPKTGSTPKKRRALKGDSSPLISSGGTMNPGFMNATDPNEMDEPAPEFGSRSASPQPRAETLEFGPDLQSIAAMPRPPSAMSNGEQPNLKIQPPRTSAADAQSQAGLPRDFIERLYTTFHTTEGSVTGQPIKRFKCLIEGCDRHFPRKSAIISHIQTHLEDKPFTCPAPDCDSAFVRQHDLRRHMRIHSGTKPFPCPCGKGFARGDALMRHRQRGICTGTLIGQK